MLIKSLKQTIFTSCIGLTLALVLPSPALADDVDVAARFKVLKGKSLPAVLITANKKVRRVELNLTRDDGKKVNVVRKAPPVKKQVALEWKQEVGKHKYNGKLVIVFRDSSEAAMPLNFEVEVAAGDFAIEMTEADLDLENHTFTTRVGCKVDKLEVEIDGEDGVLDRVTSQHHGAPANSPLTVRWDQPAGKQVMRIVVKPLCSDGVFREQHFYPWDYPVEHEEVNFPSGSHSIPAGDRHKLDASYQAVAVALKKFSRWGKPKLYIAGHTDTVAGKAYNRDLSRRRAKSIASYFKKKGLRVEIYYIGFGEEAPVVQTPDETAEPRNRRAEYIISVNEPGVEIQGFDGRWLKL